ncbi:transposase family protein [Loigolactobacillus coryniformis]|uniref:helix-turn-helix domain-containing protein n=1 Tax=Loigolactobacillus coryniformis TaxID=1610 RepID=UPI00345CBBA6
MPLSYADFKHAADSNFKREFGVNHVTFDAMCTVLAANYQRVHQRRGRKSKLLIADKVTLMLRYYRKYNTFAELSFEFGISESTAHTIVTHTERALKNSGQFNLLDKKVLLDDEVELDILVVDATGTKIQRPKKTKSVLLWQTQMPHAQKPVNH